MLFPHSMCFKKVKLVGQEDCQRSECRMLCCPCRYTAVQLIDNHTEDVCLVTTSGGQTKPDLEGIVDEPLEGCERPDHDDTSRQTIPKPREADVSVDPGHSFGSGLSSLSLGVEFADHDVRGVRDDSTGDAGNIPAQETDAGLLQLVVALLGFAQLLVDEVDSLLEGRELTHRVWDLAAPQRRDTLVQARDSFLLDDPRPALSEIVRVGRQCRLHADLDGFERAQEHVRDEFRARARAQVH